MNALICLHTRFETCTQKALVHRHMHTFIGAKDRVRERMKTTSNFMHMQTGTAVSKRERGKLEGAQGTHDCLISKLQSLTHRDSRIAGMYVSRKRISSTSTGRQTLMAAEKRGAFNDVSSAHLCPSPPPSPATPPSCSFSPFSTQRNAKGLMTRYKRARQSCTSWIYNKRWSFFPS
jgi:hypothetical protein